MCMGGGGGGGGSVKAAKINEPTTAEYKEIAKVVKGIERDVLGLLSPKHPLNESYQLLNSSNAGLMKVMLETEELQKKAASHQVLLAQDAARLANLKGPPPPEKGAEAPLIGAQREEPRSTMERGRSSLRIDRTTPSLTV